MFVKILLWFVYSVLTNQFKIMDNNTVTSSLLGLIQCQFSLMSIIQFSGAVCLVLADFMEIIAFI